MLILSVLLQLSSNAVSSRRDKSVLYARTSIIFLLISYILTHNGYNEDYLGNGISMFHGLFHTSALVHMFHLFAFIICIIILNLNAFYPRKV